MANPRQRRKAKSSTHKPVSHSRRAKKILRKMPAIRGPKALQDAWDKSKTVRQNYASLGLQLALTPTQSGGLERTFIPPKCSPSAASVSGNTAGPSSASSIPMGFGRIIRDISGNVIRIDLPESDQIQCSVQSNELPEANVDEKTMKDWVGVLNKIQPNDRTDPQGSSSTGCTDAIAVRIKGSQEVIDVPFRYSINGIFISIFMMSTAPSVSYDSDGALRLTLTDQFLLFDHTALEKLSASGRATLRHSSCGERSYLGRLIQKYGDDYGNMAIDRRLNPEQKTVGELKRAVRKAGGVESL